MRLLLLREKDCKPFYELIDIFYEMIGVGGKPYLDFIAEEQSQQERQLTGLHYDEFIAICKSYNIHTGYYIYESTAKR